jgi:hypothetical protein
MRRSVHPCKPRQKRIQASAIRKISGNGLVVETTKPGSLKAFTENEKLQGAGLKASTPQRHPPTLQHDHVRRPEEEDTGMHKKVKPGKTEGERRCSHQVLLKNGTPGSTGDQLGIRSTLPPAAGRGQVTKRKNIHLLERV